MGSLLSSSQESLGMAVMENGGKVDEAVYRTILGLVIVLQYFMPTLNNRLALPEKACKPKEQPQTRVFLVGKEPPKVTLHGSVKLRKQWVPSLSAIVEDSDTDEDEKELEEDPPVLMRSMEDEETLSYDDDCTISTLSNLSSCVHQTSVDCEEDSVEMILLSADRSSPRSSMEPPKDITIDIQEETPPTQETTTSKEEESANRAQSPTPDSASTLASRTSHDMKDTSWKMGEKTETNNHVGIGEAILQMFSLETHYEGMEHICTRLHDQVCIR